METNPQVGFACCPAMKLNGEMESGVEGRIEERDRLFAERAFLLRLLSGNCVPAASGMVRRACYTQCGGFPLDLPYAGDWFLWLAFALHFDVAYFAEPMVYYRTHELSMTNYLMNRQSALAFKEGFLVLWRIRKQAQAAGCHEIAEKIGLRLANLYGTHLLGGSYGGHSYGLTSDEVELSVWEHAGAAEEASWMFRHIWTAAGDCSLKRYNFSQAAEYYSQASQYDRWSLSLRLKGLLILTGNRGLNLAGTLMKMKSAAAGVVAQVRR
jgi:hypothetical protein